MLHIRGSKSDISSYRLLNVAIAGMMDDAGDSHVQGASSRNPLLQPTSVQVYQGTVCSSPALEMLHIRGSKSDISSFWTAFQGISTGAMIML